MKAEKSYADPYPFMFSSSGGARGDPLPDYYKGFTFRFKSREHNDSMFEESHDEFNAFKGRKSPFEDLPKDYWHKDSKSDMTDFGETDDHYPYCVFGLKRSSSDEDMKKAYKKSILKSHPDKGGDPEEFRMYREAWEYYSS